MFLVQSMLIIAFSRLIGVWARKLGQPMVIAEITAGILLGPSLLGWLFPRALETLFPAQSMPFLGLASQVGLIFFMFLIGLELDANLLRGHGRASIVISHTSIVVPFALGALLAVYIYPSLSPSDVSFMSFMLFLGAAMSITAFPVLARIMTERHLLRTRLGAITIACAAVDDVTAWCILAFVVSTVRAASVGDAVVTTLLALGYIAVMAFLLRPFLLRLGARGVDRHAMTQNVVALTFFFVLLSSLITESIGIHALFGAFLLGAIMPREGGYAQALAEKIEDFVVVFLLPLFFAYSGLRTQIGLLDSPGLWACCGIIILVACLGKFGGSALAARLVGLNWREAGAIGILMNTRGLMELIVLNIGLDLGVISPTLFTMMVIMALVTTFITTPLLHWMYPRELVVEYLPSAPRSAEGYSVLMCVANNATGPGMATLSAALAGDDLPNTTLYALRLVPPAERTSSYVEQSAHPAHASGSVGLIPLLQRSEELGLQVHPISFVSTMPGASICEVARARSCDLVLLGWHKPLLGQTVLGGTVYHVMTNAPCDVGMLVDRGLKEIRRVLVPYYGTPHDRAAMKVARRLNVHSGAEVTILHVVSPTRDANQQRLGVQDHVDAVFPKQDEKSGEVRLKVVENNDPPAAALAEARGHYDLVIIGVGEGWGLEERRFSLTPERIIQDCPTSLLIVRAGQR